MTGVANRQASMRVLTTKDQSSSSSSCFEAKVQLRHGHGQRVILGNIDREYRDSVELAVTWVSIHFNALNKHIMGTSRRSFMTKYEDLVLEVWDLRNPVEGYSGGLSIALAVLGATMGCPLNKTICGVTGGLNLDGLVIPVGDSKAKVLLAQRLGFTKLLMPGASYMDVMEEERASTDGGGGGGSSVREYCHNALVPVANMLEVLSHMVPGKCS